MQDHDQQHEWGGPVQDMKDNVNVAIGLSQGIAAPIEALLCKPPFGERYFGGKAVIGLLAPLLIAFGGGKHDGEIAMGAAMVACCAFGWQNAERKRLEKLGMQIHSKQRGTPRFKGAAGLVFFAGLLCSPFSHALAVYLCVASAAYAISLSAMRMEWAGRKRNLQDAMLEQRVLMGEMEREEE
ncbi:MAG: hypothetical protein HY040_07520 [Planctomycetes bacterium]|nr:hypothetical protein [Planctomycetota bacterium]